MARSGAWNQKSSPTRSRGVEVVGLPTMQGYRAGLAELVRGGHWVSGIQPGAVEHVHVPLGERG